VDDVHAAHERMISEVDARPKAMPISYEDNVTLESSHNHGLVRSPLRPTLGRGHD